MTALIAGLAPNSTVSTYSNVYPGYNTDETAYIDLTARRYQVQSHRVAFQPPGPANSCGSGACAWPQAEAWSW